MKSSDLATANRKRQWPRNVAVRPEVTLKIGNETFTGRVEVIADRVTIQDVIDRRRTAGDPFARMLAQNGEPGACRSTTASP